LSNRVIDGTLRTDIGFDGVVFSDDLQMGAIREHYELETVVRLALDAGVDIMTFANNSVFEPDIAERAIAIVEGLVTEGVVTQERIETSYQRIMRLKENLGLR
jgi:beta-N-acetylhexosaminidase